MAGARCFRVNPADNVATLLEDAEPGPLILVGEGGAPGAVAAIALGHKVALERIAAGAEVIKFGVPIGRAKADIQPGEWVHLHNVESNYDARAAHYDVNSGAPSDTIYE